uniref:ORF16 n=1 Tax=Kallithea virus TaxID=1654582 RepID=A0A0F7KMZ3_9VIRU|nr:ORF16 [Kallithea virus]
MRVPTLSSPLLFSANADDDNDDEVDNDDDGNADGIIGGDNNSFGVRVVDIGVVEFMVTRRWADVFKIIVDPRLIFLISGIRYCVRAAVEDDADKVVSIGGLKIIEDDGRFIGIVGAIIFNFS